MVDTLINDKSTELECESRPIGMAPNLPPNRRAESSSELNLATSDMVVPLSSEQLNLGLRCRAAEVQG